MGFEPSGIEWLFLDMNSYFASVEQQENPAYRGRPLIVLPTMTDFTCAIAASQEAKAYGIKTNTGVAEARGRCPGLICVPARHDVYMRYHHRIVACVDRHTPVTKVCSVDEMACRLDPRHRSEEAAIALSLAIKAALRAEVGEAVTCSIGLSSNAYLAKVATDLQKPDGLVVLLPQDVQARLKGKPLTFLPGIGRNMERRLNRAGVWMLDDLWRCGPKQMRALWHSVEGEKMWYRLRGYHIPDQPTKPSVVGHSRVLDPAYRAPNEARAIASQLTEKACNRMRRKGYCAGVFSLGIRDIEGRRFGIDVPVDPPSADNARFVALVHRMWDGLIAAHRPVRLKKVSVAFSGLRKPEEIAPDLFHAADEKNIVTTEKQKKISSSIDQIIKKFGSDAIHFGYTPEAKSKYVGTKIAFNRIPEMEEFQ